MELSGNIVITSKYFGVLLGIGFPLGYVGLLSITKGYIRCHNLPICPICPVTEER